MCSPTADMLLPAGKPRFFGAWGGGPLGEGQRGSGGAEGRKRTFAAGKTGARDDGFCMIILYRIPSLSGNSGVCPFLHVIGAMMSGASFTCCVVVAGSKVSTGHLFVLIRTWKLFKNAYFLFLGLSNGNCSSQLEELLPGLHHFFSFFFF